MRKSERIALWSLISALLLSQIITTVLLYGEIAELRIQIEVAVGARPTRIGVDPALPTLTTHVGSADTWGTSLTVRALGASQPLSDTAVITLTARGSGAADPLLDLPVLECGGSAHPVDGASLEQARQDLLALITRGEATTTLVFYNAPDLSQNCRVLLNPNQSQDSLIAPPIVVPVPRSAQ